MSQYILTDHVIVLPVTLLLPEMYPLDVRFGAMHIRLLGQKTTLANHGEVAVNK